MSPDSPDSPELWLWSYSDHCGLQQALTISQELWLAVLVSPLYSLLTTVLACSLFYVLWLGGDFADIKSDLGS